MHSGYVYHILAQVKTNPNKIEESDTLILAHSLQEAMDLFENEILPATVYHYHMIADQGTCLHAD